jgi:uncharacterized protein (TIGR00730 family)
MSLPQDARIQSVCVYCGSRPGHDPALMNAAVDLGEMLAQRGLRLVYGAGDTGLMGAVARSMQAAGGQTLGVIPQHLMRAEVAKRDVTTLIVTETMHERKKIMFTNADAVIVLPGGAGTLDEFFEVLTWAQIGLHEKKIYLLNINGFWDILVQLLDHVVTQGLAEPSLRDLVEVVADVETLRARLA